jgi:hypothetical protein
MLSLLTVNFRGAIILMIHEEEHARCDEIVISGRILSPEKGERLATL